MAVDPLHRYSNEEERGNTDMCNDFKNWSPWFVQNYFIVVRVKQLLECAVMTCSSFIVNADTGKVGHLTNCVI